jgi:hypothetical protein
MVRLSTVPYTPKGPGSAMSASVHLLTGMVCMDHSRNGSVHTPLGQKGAHTEEDRKPNCINAWPLRTQPSSNPKRSQPRFSAAV